MKITKQILQLILVEKVKKEVEKVSADYKKLITKSENPVFYHYFAQVPNINELLEDIYNKLNNLPIFAPEFGPVAQLDRASAF